MDLTLRNTESLRNLQYLKLSFAHNNHIMAKVFEQRACKINHPMQTLKSFLQYTKQNGRWNHALEEKKEFDDKIKTISQIYKVEDADLTEGVDR